MKLIDQWNFYQYANITDIGAGVANSSTDINDSVILVSVMDFTDVPMLKIWPILADTDTDINIGASLIKIIHIECKSIRINCVHTEFALSQSELNSNSVKPPSEVVWMRIASGFENTTGSFCM